MFAWQHSEFSDVLFDESRIGIPVASPASPASPAYSPFSPFSTTTPEPEPRGASMSPVATISQVRTPTSAQRIRVALKYTRLLTRAANRWIMKHCASWRTCRRRSNAPASAAAQSSVRLRAVARSVVRVLRVLLALLGVWFAYTWVAWLSDRHRTPTHAYTPAELAAEVHLRTGERLEAYLAAHERDMCVSTLDIGDSPHRHIVMHADIDRHRARLSRDAHYQQHDSEVRARTRWHFKALLHSGAYMHVIDPTVTYRAGARTHPRNETFTFCAHLPPTSFASFLWWNARGRLSGGVDDVVGADAAESAAGVAFHTRDRYEHVRVEYFSIPQGKRINVTLDAEHAQCVQHYVDAFAGKHACDEV